MGNEQFSFDLLKPSPLLVIISGPSASGKDSIVAVLQERGLPFFFVVTATDRLPRPKEVDGIDYIFVSTERFEQMIENNELLEYARVYDNYKGVPRANVRAALQSGKDVIMRLDVQGAARVRMLCPDAVLIFVTPANEEEWLKRFKERKTETFEEFQRRINFARNELKCAAGFDYVVVNADNQLEKATDDVMAIIRAEHMRVRSRIVSL